MPFIETADRTSLFVTDWGSGPPVVFTHAWGLRSDQWTYQVPALAAPRRRTWPVRQRPRHAQHRPARVHQRPRPCRAARQHREPGMTQPLTPLPARR
jgi:pimeloyl-ACP methyl ester carboxylesterase